MNRLILAPLCLFVGACTTERESRPSGSRAELPPREGMVDVSGPARPVGASENVRILSILHQKDQEEVVMGALAQRRGQSQEARSYGDMLVKDHSKHGTEVANLAADIGLPLWGEAEIQQDNERTGGMAPDRTASALESIEDARFDREFGKAMLEGHNTVIAVLEQARPRLVDAKVRELVDRTLPALRRHADAARVLASR